LLNAGTLEDFTGVDAQISAGDVRQVDVKAGGDGDGDSRAGPLRPLSGDQAPDGRRLRVEHSHVEWKSVFVERLERQ